jgi:colanic acid biosynthesis glycosyl transferase WcaI
MLRGRRTIRFFERLEKFIYRHSRKIFAISEEFKANLRGKGVAEDKVVVIPNFADTDFIRPMAKANAFSQAHELTDKYVVLYAGNIGLSQGLEVILDAAGHLRDRSEIVFLIVGQGARRDALVTEAERRGLNNVRFLPLQPEADVPLLYASCDVALIPLRRGIIENSVPCKTYSVMAAGRPYIACVDRGSNVWKLTETAGCGVCVEPEDGKALAEAVLQLQSEPAMAQAMGRNGREYVTRHFSREVITDRYRVALEAVVENQPLPVSEAARSASLSSE